MKFIAATGMLLGLPGAVFTLFIGSFAGSLGGICYALYRRRPLRRTAIPFGPFLASGAVLWVFFGNLLCRALRG